MALIDTWYREREQRKRKVSTSDKARITLATFCWMMFGVIKPHESGTFGLKGPMPYPAFFLIVFVFVSIVLMVVFGNHA